MNTHLFWPRCYLSAIRAPSLLMAIWQSEKWKEVTWTYEPTTNRLLSSNFLHLTLFIFPAGVGREQKDKYKGEWDNVGTAGCMTQYLITLVCLISLKADDTSMCFHCIQAFKGYKHMWSLVLLVLCMFHFLFSVIASRLPVLWGWVNRRGKTQLFVQGHSSLVLFWIIWNRWRKSGLDKKNLNLQLSDFTEQTDTGAYRNTDEEQQVCKLRRLSALMGGFPLAFSCCGKPSLQVVVQAPPPSSLPFLLSLPVHCCSYDSFYTFLFNSCQKLPSK